IEMAKGSQLKQLKSALSNAGITAQPQSKKRKRSAAPPPQQDKEKRAAKLSAIHERLNPFDVKVTKLKHDVGGRKLKGVTGKPARSTQAGIEQRKETLLKEYEARGHAGGVVDYRFGENNPSMSVEERMLERFTRERQRASKATAFVLEDEDELTHYGQSLSKMDDFDDVVLMDDNDDEDDDQNEQINRDTVSATHFAGFSDAEEDDESEQPARKKSKAEVMAEVIAKSKEHKVLRQIERERAENVRHELDQEFDSLRDLLFAPDPSASRSGPKFSISNASESTSDALPAPATDPSSTGSNNYDQRVRELAFDQRAKPKDRTKTEEELALEEKEALEKAEHRRLRRMRGEPDSSDSEGDGGAGKKRKRGGDDLDDDFYEIEEESAAWAGLGAGLKEAGNVESDQGGTENGSEEQDEGDSDEDGSSEGQDGVEDEDPEADADTGPHKKVTSAPPSKTRKQACNSDKELPYTFTCPATHEEFLEILADVEDKDISLVLQRIRALHHPSLAPDNKLKLQSLIGVLIDHILYVTSPPLPRFHLLAALLPHLCALTKAYPIPAAEHFVRKLKLMEKNLRRGLACGATDPDARTWPGPAEVALLRVIGAVWPTSDLHHAVISPARVLMGAYLGLARVRSCADLASGLVLCTLFCEFEQLSKRLVPEALCFLQNAVVHLAPLNGVKTAAALPGSFPSPDFDLATCRICSSQNVEPAESVNLPKLLLSTDVSEQDKADLLMVTLKLLRRFADFYKGFDAFIELFDPVLALLKLIDQDKLTDAFNTRLLAYINELGRLLKFARQARRPLLLQAHKPIPIPTYVPKFESSSSSYIRNQDPDRERNEAAKLRRQYKEERKGAIRELRKDARFLAGVQQQEQREKDKVYQERMKRVFGSIESERAEEKAMQKEKAREKRRAGRK
ncbi:Nop14-like protein, partial [Fistulina hepatica ATCC 64428]